MKKSALPLAFLTMVSVVWGQKPLPTPPTPCLAVRVSSPGVQAGRANVFSASQVTDLVFTVVLGRRPVAGDTLELRVFTPTGALYQSLVVPLAEAGKTPGERSVKGFPYPKPEVPVRSVGSGNAQNFEVDVPFPVGGTLIVQNGLYGPWNVEPYLYGQRASCGPPTRFEITP